MNKNILLVSLCLFFAACGNYDAVPERTLNDKNLTCVELKSEISKMEHFREKIDIHRSDTTSKIAMGLLFWPGLVVDGMNSTEALHAVNKRLSVLYGFFDKKGCR